ncbi:TPA: hypothetical protein QDA94_006523 [Burkholderia vietnamiensis]|uniref:hypothetical protein n=1 Tax=Burkholderia vietnamiensis TaxID=60552 RepID=UPI00298848D3|nr:hypothetical protein [Burkholderia vietnamiensis]HDR9236270.1 hypothetical protein [Burkholderia vietnamiensis]
MKLAETHAAELDNIQRHILTTYYAAETAAALPLLDMVTGSNALRNELQSICTRLLELHSKLAKQEVELAVRSNMNR